MNKTIKENFRQFLSTPDEIITLEEAGKCGPPYDNVLGNYWHKFLSNRIKGKEIEEEKDARVADSLFQKVKSEFGIVLLDSEFPLHCYIYDGEEVYFWKGDADAIGWYYNERRGQHEYVIVDWKVQRDLLGFWKKSDAYGKFLHQCLVYARLLQLHLDLDYLPAILIVPISSDNGQDIYPGLFYDYPDDCKNTINQYSWSKKQPEPSQKIKKTNKVLKDSVENGVVIEEMLLTELFAEGAKVKDLLKAFDFKALEVID